MPLGLAKVNDSVPVDNRVRSIILTPDKSIIQARERSIIQAPEQSIIQAP